MFGLNVVEIKIAKNELILKRKLRNIEENENKIITVERYSLSKNVKINIQENILNKMSIDAYIPLDCKEIEFANDNLNLITIEIQIKNNNITIIRVPLGKENLFCMGVSQTYSLDKQLKINIEKDFKKCSKCGNYFLDLKNNEICEECFEEVC